MPRNSLKNRVDDTLVVYDQTYNIREAYVLSEANLKVAGRIKYMPIYMLMFVV